MVSLQPVAEADRPVLDNLMQLYVYDWSELSGLEVDERGRFPAYPLDAYWHDAGRHPFLLRADAAIAGFALVQAESRLSGARGTFDMAEFFVLRRHRRRGVGREAAALLFDRFRGPWEIRQRAENPLATLFWRRAVAAYTGGGYDEAPWADAKGAGVVQRLSSAP